MSELLGQLTSISWWFSVVLVGIIVSLVGARADRWLASFSAWARARSARRQQNFERYVAQLRESPERRLVAVAAETRSRLRCLTSLVFGMFLFLLASEVAPEAWTWPIPLEESVSVLLSQVVLYSLGAVAMISSIATRLSAGREKQALSKAMADPTPSERAGLP